MSVRIGGAGVAAIVLLFNSHLAPALDLTHATVVYPPKFAGPEKKAIDVLVEEVEKRSQVHWAAGHARPGSAPYIAVDRGSGAQEGYRIQIRNGGVEVLGNDARGVLFGVGRLLRELRMSRGAIAIPDGFQTTTAPKYSLRGHQLGYRPKPNSYDGWSVAVWDQYIRDLAIFGANAIELIPPRSDDEADSPHFPLPQMEMMTRMSGIVNDYGLDVWIWYPAMDADYSNPKTVESALKEWGEVFRKLPRVDAVFVPGGDPGHTQPKFLMALLEKQTQVLHRYHPKAQMWVSPQSFTQAWLDEFIGILEKEQPAWLSGVVFGPQIRVSLPKLRSLVPKRYPIRNYPDITHSRHCQFPVPDWDIAYALTEAREIINPRPLGQAHIFRLLQPLTMGFLTYSEGCNDDVNKFVWSGLGWDPDANVVDTLRQYSRYFIGDRYTDSFTQGLLALERNWEGPLIANGNVGSTLQQFRALERAASPADMQNWRFQQALYRAYYDAYTRNRLIYETGLEEQAMDKLATAPVTGSLAALSQAEQALDRAVNEPVSQPLYARVHELAEALFQSIRMQLSVSRYQALAEGRGANLDTISVPLNDRLWLKQRFAELRRLNDEPARLKEIDEILNWTNPGPGGFYDDLGNPSRQPHLVRGPGFVTDPAFLESSLLSSGPRGNLRMSWLDHAEALNDAPLQMRYTNLDRDASYSIRVVFGSERPNLKIRLVANDDIEIHPYIETRNPRRPGEFAIPRRATANGELRLSWFREPGLGGDGRGCQVAEVWLIRK